MSVKITITHRSNDYRASIDGKPECWGCGETIDEAIGNLVNAHQQEFNIVVVYD